jgi:hypothetical protein
MTEKKSKRLPGVGLDIGTMNIVSCRRTATATTSRSIRDAFLDLDLDAKRSLRMSKVDFVERSDKLIVIGDSALQMTNLFQREVRRPLSQGLIAAGEIDAQEILSLIIQRVVEKPVTEGEKCFYSVPAAPVEEPDRDVIYHTEVFRKILTEQGYCPEPTNEAMAIIYSQTAKEQFSGLAISFGSGMANIALSYQASEAMAFSLSRAGGDWVDQGAAKAVGKTQSQMCAIKERGVDLANPENREQEAIAFYLRELVRYVLAKVGEKFLEVKNTVELPGPIPLVVSGGTSLATGFMEIVGQEFEAVKKRGFPFEISEIRRAKDPLSAVAEGLLVLATEDED